MVVCILLLKGDVIAGIHWNRDFDQMRAAVVDGSRQPVGAVIQLLCGQLNFFDCCRRNPEFSGIAVEDSCNR